MVLSPYEIALISGGFALCGALVGALCNHIFSERRRRIEEFNKAATEFRNAFLPEIILLSHNAKIDKCEGSNDLDHVLSSGYIKRHLAALEVFKNYLSTEERIDIDKAWKNYCYHPKIEAYPWFEQYHTPGRGKEGVDDKKKLALERIENILKFAEHK